MKRYFNPDGLVLSENYAQAMADIVLPYIGARRTDAVIEGEGDAPLFTSRFDADAPRGTVLVLHGFTECADKYAELIHSLLRNGYSVLAYDQRGHGRSGRDADIGDLSLTHVDRFDDYVADLARVRKRVLAGMPKPWLLFAHSMGGAVAARYLEARGGGFARAVLCAPMIAPSLRGMPLGLGRAICASARALGRGKARTFATRPYAGAERFETSSAASRERFEWYAALRAATPEFQNNGPTYGWTLESLNVTRALLADGAVEEIDVPVRVYAAETDGSVLSGPQARFAARLRDGERVLVKGAKHEIYRSTDEVLFPWWRDVLGFLSM